MRILYPSGFPFILMKFSSYKKKTKKTKNTEKCHDIDIMSLHLFSHVCRIQEEEPPSSEYCR